MPVKVRGHTRRNPGGPKMLDPAQPAQVYIVPPELAEPIPKKNRLRDIRRALRPRRPAPVRTEMDDLADEADQIASIIDGLGAN